MPIAKAELAYEGADVSVEVDADGKETSTPIAPEHVSYKVIVPNIIKDAYGKQVDIGTESTMTLADLDKWEDEEIARHDAAMAEIQAKRAAIQGL